MHEQPGPIWYGGSAVTDWNFSERELIKLLFLVVVVAVLFGYAGVLMLVCMEWLTRARYATESSAKHGISSENASRLGGALLAISSGVGFAYALLFSEVEIESAGFRLMAVAIIVTSFIGLVEDIENGLLSPRLRLILLAAVFATTFLYGPQLKPGVGTPTLLGAVVAVPLIGALLCALFAIGFINAVNMADGANGLMPGIALFVFLAFTYVTDTMSMSMSWAWALLAYIVAIFTLFNVISGRLFLGDCGSYSIGALIVLGAYSGMNAGLVSLGFLAALLSYPCVEMVLSLGRRLSLGRSPFLPDNDHFHNRLNHFFKSRFSSELVANSGTGLAISIATSGLVCALMVFDWLPMHHIGWWYIFGLLAILHIMLFMLLGSRVPRTVQFVVDSDTVT